MNPQCKVKVWSCRLAQKLELLVRLRKGDHWVLLVFTEKRESLHTSLYNLLHSLTGEMALSFSLGAAESPWGFYSPPQTPLPPANFPLPTSAAGRAASWWHLLSEWLCVLPGDVFSPSQKLVIYHYWRWPWEWFRRTAPAYRLGAQRKQHTAGQTRVMMTITSQGI